MVSLEMRVAVSGQLCRKAGKGQGVPRARWTATTLLASVLVVQRGSGIGDLERP